MGAEPNTDARINTRSTNGCMLVATLRRGYGCYALTVTKDDNATAVSVRCAANYTDMEGSVTETATLRRELRESNKRIKMLERERASDKKEFYLLEQQVVLFMGNFNKLLRALRGAGA